MTEREQAILWLSSFVKNKEPMTLIPKQLIRLMYETLTAQQEIVRCKDCQWWHESETNDGYGDCGQANGITLKPHDWFCADGERK